MSAGPHLDDDALSAHLDGYDAGEHLAGCAECRTRLDSLAAAAALVGEPPAAAPAHVLSAAVAHALDAEERRSRRPVLVALAAAALVVLGIAGVAVVGDEDRPSQSDTAALTEGSADESFAAGAASEGNPGVAFGGNLGELRDPAALSDRVRAVVEPEPAADSSEERAVIGRPSSAALQSSGGKAGATTTTVPKDPYCERAVAREYAEGLGRQVYRATLTWNGTPAVAVAYELAQPKDQLDHRLYVLATGSCQLLVAQTF